MRPNLLERKQNLSDGSERNPYPILPLPEKFRRAMDSWRETFVHGTIECSLLKDFPLRMIGREGDVNF